MTAIEFKIPYIFNSSAESGAKNISSDGSTFEVELEQPIIIPRDAINCYIKCQNATCWYVFYNIDETNNRIRFTYDDGITIEDETLTIDPGLYDVDHLNAEITRKLSETNMPNDLILLIPSTADQKIVIQFNFTGVQIDLTISNSIREILGFDSRLVPLAPTVSSEQYEKGDRIAEFNNLDYVLLHSDLVSRGIRVNNTYDQTIAQILIDVPAGSQIISAPFNPPEIPSNELIGEKRKTIRFYLTDQDNNFLNTRNETFSCRLVIHYTMKV